MKALYIYNPYSASELHIIERAKEEMDTYIDLTPVNQIPDALKKYVRTTPALIIVTDDLQGKNLLSEGVDGKLLATAMLYKRLDEEEKAIHDQENHRLDNMIHQEKESAQDALMDDMLLRGVI